MWSKVVWPFVGRDELLRECLDVVASGRSVLLAGPAGIGKTLLARSLADHIEGQGAPVSRFVASATTDLYSLSAGRSVPKVVVIDDVQFLDHDNVALLHQLIVDDGVSVLATFRVSDSHVLDEPLAALWRGDAVVRIDLDPLTREDLDRLLGQVLGGPIEASTRRRLWDLTLGAPLFMRELVNSSLRSHALVERSGMWRLERPPVSPALDELIEQRVAGLDAATGRVVELVALGEPIGLSRLIDTLSSEAVESAEESGLIEVVVDGRRTQVRLGHPLYGDVVRRRLSSARAARHCRQLLAMTETPMGRSSDIVRAVTWQLRSGGTVVSDDMVLAARRALYNNDDVLALEFARRARDDNRVAAAIVESEALSNVGRHEQAEKPSASWAVPHPTWRSRSSRISGQWHCSGGSAPPTKPSKCF